MHLYRGNNLLDKDGLHLVFHVQDTLNEKRPPTIKPVYGTVADFIYHDFLAILVALEYHGYDNVNIGP